MTPPMMLTQLTSPTAAQAASSSNINASNLTQGAQMLDAAQTIFGQYKTSFKGPSAGAQSPYTTPPSAIVMRYRSPTLPQNTENTAAKDSHFQKVNASICFEEKKQQTHSNHFTNLEAVGAKFSDKFDTQNKLREVKKREISDQTVPSSTGDRPVCRTLTPKEIERKPNQGVATAADYAKNAHRKLQEPLEVALWIKWTLDHLYTQGQLECEWPIGM